MSHGYGDGFISNVIDTLREPIDFYLRDSSSNCQRSILNPCIVSNNTNLNFQNFACDTRYIFRLRHSCF
jgi:hypothetical protein